MQTNKKHSSRPWPLDAANLTPLALWRSIPSDKFAEAEGTQIRSILQRVCVFRADDDLRRLLRGDPEGVIRVISTISDGQDPTLEIDVAMTAVLCFALEGHAVAAFAVGNVIGRMELAHDLATELSASWYRVYLDRSPGRQHPPEVASLLKIHTHDAPGSRRRPRHRKGGTGAAWGPIA